MSGGEPGVTFTRADFSTVAAPLSSSRTLDTAVFNDAIIRENNANKTEVENLAVQMFGGGVRTLNRMQASNLIDELFAKYPRRSGSGSGRGNYQRQAARS